MLSVVVRESNPADEVPREIRLQAGRFRMSSDKPARLHGPLPRKRTTSIVILLAAVQDSSQTTRS